MIAKRLRVTTMVALSTLSPCRSKGQSDHQQVQILSPSDASQFFQGKIQADGVWARDNSRYLHLMREKPLADTIGPQAAEVYRLLVQTSPHGIPVVVRFSIAPDGSGSIVGKMGHSPRSPDILTVDRVEKVSQEDTRKFLKLLTDSGFWSMPVYESIDLHHVTMGDASWMFEGEREGAYHVICRGTSSLASLRKTLMFLVAMSKIDLASTTNGPK
jgi:hypothetical protein